MRYVGQARRIDKLEKLNERVQKQKNHVDITINDDGSIIFHNSGLIYKPYPTLQKFRNDKSNLKIMVGAFGSGKSTETIVEMIGTACEMPRCNDGIRRCRWTVFRSTVKQLKETVLDLWQTWCTGLGIIHELNSIPMQWTHDFNDGHGIVHLEVWFLAVDSEKQLRDLKSLQTTNACISELSEAPETLLKYMLSRVGRYPAKILLPEENRNYHRCVIGDTNAPDSDHWLPRVWEKDTQEITGHSTDNYLINRKTLKYKIFEEEHELVISIYHQPPALLEEGKDKHGNPVFVANPLAENIENLAGGYEYYFSQIPNGYEFVRVFAQGKYGIIKAGQLVFSSFNEDLHVAQSIAIDKDHEVLIGVDFGYDCPAFVICQYVQGQLRCIKEFAGQTLYIEDLYKSFVEPWLLTNAKGIVYRSFDDPANTMHGRFRLKEIGFESEPSVSNKLDDRLPAVSSFLNRLSQGKAAFIVSKDGCPSLCAGFMGKYVFEMVKTLGEERPKKQPKKTHPYSDVMDGVQYVALHLSLDLNKKPKDYSQFMNREKW